ncbi:MAG: Transposase [uncultured Pyrinomonadaceae bacterium]|uniref:Transposase n=1 Tax=uncultured Pyrinomonadaceae bacterium TaxID=2283094 RepID=A0A6J4NLD5_9BACT|nr:MAG: Transposase [uncultured Pyrinomonadaceae bacterium]
MKRKTYPTDLSDEQWKLLETMLPPAERFGRKQSVNLRQIFNALCYLARSGCQWRLLPKEFPKWQTVYYYFRLWRDAECFVALNEKLRRKLRLSVGRQAHPSAAIIDSQSVKTDEQAISKGYDAGKKVKGRKRHILVDTLGLLLKAKVLTADIQDRDGAKRLFSEIKEQMPRLQLIWADGGYRGKLILWVAAQCLWILEIVKRNDREKFFIVLPKRWIVERTFSWLNRNRRLSKDYERKTESSEAWLYLSMSMLMLKRLKF